MSFHRKYFFIQYVLITISLPRLYWVLPMEFSPSLHSPTQLHAIFLSEENRKKINQDLKMKTKRKHKKHNHTSKNHKNTEVNTILYKPKTCKTKQNKMSKLSSMRQKSLLNIMKLVLRWLSTSGMGPSLSVVNIPSDPPLKRTNFSSANRCQLEIAPWLRMGAHVHFSLSALGPVWLEPV